MKLTAEEFLKETGLQEPLLPGQIKYIHKACDKPGSSYTIVYDWRTDPEKIRIEVRPGLTGTLPDKKGLHKFDMWLQTETYLEFDMSGRKTKH